MKQSNNSVLFSQKVFYILLHSNRKQADSTPKLFTNEHQNCQDKTLCILSTVIPNDLVLTWSFSPSGEKDHVRNIDSITFSIVEIP